MCVLVSHFLSPALPPSFKTFMGPAAMVDADGLAYKDVLRELGAKGEATHINQ